MVIRRDVEGTITKVSNCKVAVYAQGFDTSGPETKGTVLIHNAAELESYAKTEETRMEEIVKGVADAGVKVRPTYEKEAPRVGIVKGPTHVPAHSSQCCGHITTR
jgi:chaperonin GroEL (HSP60 family)